MEKRPGSPTHSSVSMKSDGSYDHGRPNFREGEIPSDQRAMEKRPGSPTHSRVSMKSDGSYDHGRPDFREGELPSDPRVMEKRPGSPTHSSVSMKSDGSYDHGRPDFREGELPSDPRKQRRKHAPDSSGQNEQQDLTHVFQMLEKKIIAFVKNELQRFKGILSPDYQENFERKERDESDARDGALKMALHFLLKMERNDLADKLREIQGTDVLSRHQAPSGEESMTILHKSAVDKALEYKDGRFDLFLRFLLGLSLESNQTLLRGLLQKGQEQTSNDETISYIKDKIREAPSSERVINLFHCLNELNDHSLVEEIQSFLSAGSLSEVQLSPGQWSALLFVLLTSDQKLDVFDLKKYVRSDEGLLRLKPIVEESQTLLLDSCRLSKMSCTILASVLCKVSSKVNKLDLSDNSIGDVGVQELCNGLKNPNCALESLRLLKSDAADQACVYLTSVLGTNPLLLTELELSRKIVGDSGVKQICALLEDSHCRIKKLKLRSCSITGEGCAALTSALTSNPSHLIELHLDDNELGDSGVKQISALLRNPDCKLQILGLQSCSITGEGCAALTSALTSNPSHLIELYLGVNKLGDSEVKQISALLRNPDCKLQILGLRFCSITGEGCAALTSALASNPSHLIELYLGGNKLGDSGVKQISALLRNPDCKLQTLWLESCSITGEGCAALTSALASNPSHLIQLHLDDNKLGGSGLKQISALLKNPDCKLKTLWLSGCSITEEGCAALTSALISNPSHLIELNLSRNELGDSGVKQISALLRNPDCKLQKLG
ncbi:hypothetical protein ACEWY4_025163 [Coilia grayii]|uniref:NACHT LRR and PYD domain-containing protein n=1 Tax=Coilia grayii TaxID=363190 RepID=A0ABD1IXU0_9TELE